MIDGTDEIGGSKCRDFGCFFIIIDYSLLPRVRGLIMDTDVGGGGGGGSSSSSRGGVGIDLMWNVYLTCLCNVVELAIAECSVKFGFCNRCEPTTIISITHIPLPWYKVVIIHHSQ